MFRGANAINLDAKGRMAIPARYRERLLEISSGTLIVTKNPYETQHRNLLVFPLSVWEPIEAKINALPLNNKANQIVRRLTVHSAKEIEVDGNGRVLLPVELREYAGLDKGLMLVGQGDSFQIWDETRWKEQEAADMAALADEDFNIDDLPDLAF